MHKTDALQKNEFLQDLDKNNVSFALYFDLHIHVGVGVDLL